MNSGCNTHYFLWGEYMNRELYENIVGYKNYRIPINYNSLIRSLKEDELQVVPIPLGIVAQSNSLSKVSRPSHIELKIYDKNDEEYETIIYSLVFRILNAHEQTAIITDFKISSVGSPRKNRTESSPPEEQETTDVLIEKEEISNGSVLLFIALATISAVAIGLLSSLFI